MCEENRILFNVLADYQQKGLSIFSHSKHRLLLFSLLSSFLITSVFFCQDLIILKCKSEGGGAGWGGQDTLHTVAVR